MTNFTTSDVLIILVPLAATLLSHAVLWGRLSEKLDSHDDQIKQMHDWKDEVTTQIATIEQEAVATRTDLVGISGSNGLRSEVRSLSAKLDRLLDIILEMKSTKE